MKKTEKNGHDKKPVIEVKMVKHVFDLEESNELGMTMARANQTLNEIDGEFEQIKSNFKSRIAEQEAIIGRASSCRISGYEMRNARCRVVYRPKEGKKDYYLEFADEKALPVETVDMTPADMQAQLIADEPKFERLETIEVWKSEADGPCVIQVGRLSAELLGKKTDMWFAALDVRINGQALLEKLDNDQPCATKRIDIIRRASKRLKTWLVSATDKEAAKGFDEKIDAAVEGQKERVE